MLFKAGLLDRVRRAAHVVMLCSGLPALIPFSAVAASSVTLAWNPSSGTNIAGYKIYYGVATLTYTNTINVGSVTNAAISNLVSGTIYYFAATAYDTSGLESDYSTEVAYTNVTATPPSVALTAPANGASYAAPATINLAASVTANGHTITQVQFYSGATLLATDTSAPYTFTWANVSAGSYSLTAQATYDTGSTVASTPANVTVTNVPPPSIALTAPANGASYTAPAAISLAASVTANGHTITRVQFYNGATLLATDTSAPYTFTWTSVAAGDYSLTAQVVYDSGSGVASTAANVTVTNPPPLIVLSTPTNGASYVAPATISLAASVNSNGHTITKVQFFNGATLLGTDTSTPYNFVWTNVSAGSYNLTAEAVYDSGSTIASSVENVTVTNVPLPSIALTSPASGDSYTEPATIDLVVDVNANGHTITKVQFYNGSTLLAEDTSAPYTFTWTGVSAGTYSLMAQAVYDAGSTVASTPATNVLVAAARPGSASPAISAIADQTMTTNSTQRMVNFTISDAGTPASNLVFYASSTNQALLPAGNILFQGGNTNCTVILMPVSGQTGQVDITITLSNAISSVTADTTFHLSVTAQAVWNLWWENVGGYLASWSMSGTNIAEEAYLNPSWVDPSWKIVGTGDFNGDGQRDILWQQTDGWIGLWLMNGTNSARQMLLTSSPVAAGWRIVGTGDFNGDGQCDILWQHTDGWVGLWLMNGTNCTQKLILNSSPVPAGWQIVGTGDFNGDGQCDIVWQHTDGWVGLWLMNGSTCSQQMILNSSPVAAGWRIVGVADINGDDKPDLLWQHDSGPVGYWEMNGTRLDHAGLFIGGAVNPSWKVAGPK